MGISTGEEQEEVAGVLSCCWSSLPLEVGA